MRALFFFLALLLPSLATLADQEPATDVPMQQENNSLKPDPSTSPLNAYPENASDNTSGFKKAFYKTMTILISGLILVFLAIWLFRKFSSSKFHTSNQLKSIKILEKRPISPKSILYLIEIGGQKILISESQLEVRMISELKWLENTRQGL